MDMEGWVILLIKYLTCEINLRKQSCQKVVNQYFERKRSMKKSSFCPSNKAGVISYLQCKQVLAILCLTRKIIHICFYLFIYFHPKFRDVKRKLFTLA